MICAFLLPSRHLQVGIPVDFPILAGGDAGDPLKGDIEIVGTVVADMVGNLGDGHLGFDKDGLGFADAQVGQILDGRVLKLFFENVGEVGRGYVKLLSHILNLYPLLIMLLHQFLGLPSQTPIPVVLCSGGGGLSYGHLIQLQQKSTQKVSNRLFGVRGSLLAQMLHDADQSAEVWEIYTCIHNRADVRRGEIVFSQLWKA